MGIFTDISNFFLPSSISAANNNFDLTEAELTARVRRDGSVPMLGNLDMNSNQLINLADGTTDGAAATVGQVNSIPKGDTGDRGPQGYAAITLAQLKAAEVSDGLLNHDGAVFTWTVGDYTGQSDDTNIIESDDYDLSEGAWVRQGADKIAFQPLDSATTRDIRAKLLELAVSPEDHGAAADGVTDDTAAIEAAIATGRPVYIAPDKTYYTVAGITVTTPGARISGAGTIKRSGSDTTNNGGGVAGITVLADGVSISGITIDVSSVGAGRTISAKDFDGLTIDGVTSKNTGQIFVLATGTVKNLVVQNCRNPEQGYGVLINDPAAGSSGAVITGNIFLGTSSGQADGVEINAPTNGFKHVVVTDNIVGGMWGAALNAGIGLGFANVQNITVTGNVVYDCEGDGLHFEAGCDLVSIGSNTVENVCQSATNTTGALAIATGCSRVSVSGGVYRNGNTRPALGLTAGAGIFNTDIAISGGIYDGAAEFVASIESVKNLTIDGAHFLGANTSNAASVGTIRISKFTTNVNENIRITNCRVTSGTNSSRSMSIGVSSISGCDVLNNDFSGSTIPSPDFGGNSVNSRGNRFTATALREGTISLAAGNTTKLTNNANVDQAVTIWVTPGNAAAVALGSAFVSAITRGTNFTITVPTAAAGGEVYNYVIL